MRRHCDGTDPNLLKPVPMDPPHTGRDDPRRVQYEPCDCGLVFDDVNTFVIFPHERF